MTNYGIRANVQSTGALLIYIKLQFDSSDSLQPNISYWRISTILCQSVKYRERGVRKSHHHDHPVLDNFFGSICNALIYPPGIKARVLEHNFVQSKSSSGTEMPSQQSQQRHTIARHRGRLSGSEVQSIYLAKKPGNRATKIAGSFGVNEKTVRDIWSGRTWAKETLHLRQGDSERSGSLSGVIERKQPKGTLMVQLATDQNRDRRNEIKIENIGLEHLTDPDIISIDEQLWTWDEAIWCDLGSSDPFKLDWKPKLCAD